VNATTHFAEGVITAVIEIAAPPEAVFEALTDPGQLEAWWGAGEYRTRDWKVDLRVGGQWSVKTLGPGGRDMTVNGQYQKVEPPYLLQYTWLASWDESRETSVRFELEPAPDGTRLTLRHSGFAERPEAAEQYVGGWKLVLHWLAAYLRPDMKEE
jgi:uncharacterized protein YndB with AHSA1/START domain